MKKYIREFMHLLNNSKDNHHKGKDREKSVDQLFEEIQNYALKQDEAALMELIEDGYCINVSKKNNTPISLLAKEKKRSAVLFLIDKFNGNLNGAAYGAALGGDINFANKLLAKGANILSVLKGAAEGGHFTYVGTLVDQAKQLDPNSELDVYDHVAASAILGGHLDYAKDVLQRTNYQRIYNSLTAAGSIGNRELAYSLYEKITSSESNFGMTPIMEGAAIADDLDFMDEIKDKSNNDNNLFILMNNALFGAILAGDLKLAEYLLKHKLADYNHASSAAALSGQSALTLKYVHERIKNKDFYPTLEACFNVGKGNHIDLIKQINDEFSKNNSEKVFNLNQALTGATQQYHLKMINKVIAMGGKWQEAVTAARQSGYLNSRESLLKMMAFADNPQYRRGLLLESKNSLIHGIMVLAEKMTRILPDMPKQITSLLDIKEENEEFEKNKTITASESKLFDKATKLNQLMSNYQLDFEQARKIHEMEPSIREWLLQGPQKVRNKKLTKDNFMEISAKLLSVDEEDAKIIYNTIHLILHDELIQNVKSSYAKNSIFTTGKQRLEKESKIHEINTRSELRRSFTN